MSISQIIYSLAPTITKPYNDARSLINQAENYTHLAEIEALYESVVARETV